MHKIDLPPPISTNSLFANARKGRVKTDAYKAWRWEAHAMLCTQKPLPKFTEPVRILLAVGMGDTPDSFDGDNTFKAIIDCLVQHEIIPDDNRKTVRGIGMEWISGKTGVTVYIGPAASTATAIEIPIVGAVA